MSEQDITASAANQEGRKEGSWKDGFTVTGGMTPESQDSCPKFPN